MIKKEEMIKFIESDEYAKVHNEVLEIGSLWTKLKTSNDITQELSKIKLDMNIIGKISGAYVEENDVSKFMNDIQEFIFIVIRNDEPELGVIK